jgi:phenylalanyl-tRNA synthetase beta chain
MKISYNWLKQYLPVELSPENVAQALTSAGLEVEDVIPFETVKGSLEGIVTGKVVHCERHPNADKLSLTKVDVGTCELLSIVCGAPNVAEGQKVLVATVGTTLYSGEDSFQIKKSKIRGEVSEGMICAEDEVGLGTSHDGIMVLAEETEIGKPAALYFPVEKDFIFEIGLTPNRSDAASHIGVARDLAAILNFREGHKSYKLSLPSVDDFKVDNNDLNIEVEVVDIDACPRYSGLTINNIKIGPSPDWLKNKLKAIGVRPINNVVDVTNFVLFETGQPLHAFDASAVKGNKVVVKKLAENTAFVTLDEVERKLSSSDLIICNEEEGMCIGGVFGGLHSGVSEKTTAIFLESACFDSRTIRKTARLHGLQTDASFRFERGSDPEITIYALKRAAQLIKEITGGHISSDIKDVYPKPVKPAEVHLSFEYLDKIAGQHIPSEQALSILTDLGIEIISSDKNEAELVIPTFKVDVYRPADIVEEVLRVYGYDNIAIPSKLNASINISDGIDPDKLQHAVSDLLVANGLQEIMNNSLTRSEYSEKHPAFAIENNVQMLNPLSKDLDVLRQSLLFGGLESIAYNQNRKTSDLKMFEFGKTYRYISDKKNNNEALDAYDESLQLDLFLTGGKFSENWNTVSVPLDFYDMKFYVEAILKKLRIERNSITISEHSDDLFDVALIYHAGESELLRFGKLSQATLKIFDIRKAVFYANLKWENLLKAIPAKKVKYEAVPRFPAVRRDLALLIDKTVRFEEINRIACQTEPVLLQEVNIFDIYEGEKIAEGKKSYAVSFILVDKEKTLTDKIIDKCMQKLQTAFEQQLGAVLR